MMTADYCLKQLSSSNGDPCRILRDFILLGKTEHLEKIVRPEILDILRSRFPHTEHLPDELLKNIPLPK